MRIFVGWIFDLMKKHLDKLMKVQYYGITIKQYYQQKVNGIEKVSANNFWASMENVAKH